MNSSVPPELGELRRSAPPVRPQLVAAARDEAGGLRAAHTKARRSRVWMVAIAVGLLLALSFTPPGRAATGWLADLAGIGEEPSLEQVGSVPGSAVVIANGELSDGTSYEVVAKRVVWPGREGDERGPIHLCLQVDFPDISDKGQGGHCTDGEELGTGLGSESAGLYRAPAPGDDPLGRAADPDGPGLLMGFLEVPPAAEVRVIETDAGGEESELPSELITIDGELLEATGYDHPVSIFTSELDAETVVAGRAGDIDVRAIAYSADGGELGRYDVSFPVDCPKPKHVPPPPAGVPAEPASSRAEVREALESPCPPTDFTGPTEYVLSREPLPESVSAAVARLGEPVEAATKSDYAPLFEPGNPASPVGRAMTYVTDRAVPAVADGQEVGGVVGEHDVYLARLEGSDRLVYVVHYVAKGFTGAKAPDPAAVGLPREFIGVFEVDSGDRLAFAEVSGPR